MIDGSHVWKLAYNIGGLALITGLTYTVARLLLVFKGGIMGKAWLYVSCGVLTIAIGLFLSISQSLLDIPSVVSQIGNTVILAGGVLTLIGFFMQYRIWSPKGL